MTDLRTDLEAVAADPALRNVGHGGISVRRLRERIEQILAKHPAPTADRDEVAEELACAWADYRKDYGVNQRDLQAAHKAFKAGWQAARTGDQSGPFR